MSISDAQSRVAWIDYAKGISIILVVNMHSTLGVEASLGTTSFAGQIVTFAGAFRMPLFFIIAGLFLYRSIKQDWVQFLDKKLVHFAYFYFLWSLIQFGIKYPISAGNHDFTLKTLLLTPIEPFGTIWFIYVLSTFFLVTRALKDLHPALLVLGAVVLKMLLIATGWMVIDSFANQYIFFIAGYLGSRPILKMAQEAQNYPLFVIFASGVFTFWNIAMMNLGWIHNPVYGLAAGITGSVTIIALCTLLAKYKRLYFIRYIGKHSLYIFLAFFFPMAISRIALIKTGFIPEINTFAFLVTALSVATPLLAYVILKDTALGFLFKRPQWIKLKYSNAISAAKPSLAVDR